MIKHLHQLPSNEIIKNLTYEAQGMAGRYAHLNLQFTQYKTDISKYKNTLQNTLKERE